MAAFSVKDDWNRIEWGKTLVVNLYRALAAGVFYMLFGLFSDPSQYLSALGCVILLPVGYFLVLLPIGLLSIWLSKIGVPFVGLVSIVFAMALLFGHPLLWLFDKVTSGKFIPARVPFLSFSIIEFVVNEETMIA